MQQLAARGVSWARSDAACVQTRTRRDIFCALKLRRRPEGTGTRSAAIHAAMCVAVPVMQVRIMRMLVAQALMAMAVSVGFA